MEAAISKASNQRGQFEQLQQIPGDRSVAARQGVQDLTKEIDTLVGTKETILLASAKSAKEREKHSIAIGQEKFYWAKSLLESQVELFNGALTSHKDNLLHNNALTRYLKENAEVLQTLKEEEKKYSREASKALEEPRITRQAIDVRIEGAKQLTERMYAQQDKLQGAVASAYQDVSVRMQKLREFYRERPAGSKEELEVRIDSFKQMRNELSHIQEFSGHHTSEAMSKLVEMDKSLGEMYIIREKGVFKQREQTQDKIRHQAQTLWKQDKPQEALDIVNQALNHYPKDSTLYMIKTAVLCDLGRFEEARLSYQEAKDLGVDHTRLVPLQKYMQENIEKEEKIQALKLSLSYMEGSSKLWQQRKHVEALAMVEEGLKHNPKSPDLHIVKSLALNSLGRFDEATIAYNNALEFGASPESLTAVNNHMHYSLEKPLKGKQDKAETVLEIKQQFQILKNRRAALEALSSPIFIDPTSPNYVPPVPDRSKKPAHLLSESGSSVRVKDFVREVEVKSQVLDSRKVASSDPHKRAEAIAIAKSCRVEIEEEQQRSKVVSHLPVRAGRANVQRVSR